MAEELFKCRRLEKVTSWLTIRRVGGIHPADKWNSRQPGVVELGGGLVNVAGTSEATNGHHTVRFPIVMPAIGATNDEIEPKFVPKLVFPADISELRGKVGALAEETNIFKAVQPCRIPPQQIGLGPKRHEGRVAQPAGVSLVLHHVKMCASVSQVVCNNSNEKDVLGNAEVSRQQIGQADQDPL